MHIQPGYNSNSKMVSTTAGLTGVAALLLFQGLMGANTLSTMLPTVRCDSPIALKTACNPIASRSQGANGIVLTLNNCFDAGDSSALTSAFVVYPTRYNNRNVATRACMPLSVSGTTRLTVRLPTGRNRGARLFFFLQSSAVRTNSSLWSAPDTSLGQTPLAQLRACSRTAGSTPGSFCITSLFVSSYPLIIFLMAGDHLTSILKA